MPKIVPIETFQKSAFFVLVTGVFWRQRFACGGQRYENANAIAPAFTAKAQLSPGPKFSEDNNDATNDTGIQKHL